MPSATKTTRGNQEPTQQPNMPGSAWRSTCSRYHPVSKANAGNAGRIYSGSLPRDSEKNATDQQPHNNRNPTDGAGLVSRRIVWRRKKGNNGDHGRHPAASTGK